MLTTIESELFSNGFNTEIVTVIWRLYRRLGSRCSIEEEDVVTVYSILDFVEDFKIAIDEK
jgi:hypothetical protein